MSPHKASEISNHLSSASDICSHSKNIRLKPTSNILGIDIMLWYSCVVIASERSCCCSSLETDKRYPSALIHSTEPLCGSRTLQIRQAAVHKSSASPKSINKRPEISTPATYVYCRAFSAIWAVYGSCLCIESLDYWRSRSVTFPSRRRGALNDVLVRSSIRTRHSHAGRNIPTISPSSCPQSYSES